MIITISKAIYALTVTIAIIQLLVFRRELSKYRVIPPVGASVSMVIIVVLTPMMLLGFSGWHLLWAIPACLITGLVLIIWPPYFRLTMSLLLLPVGRFRRRGAISGSTQKAGRAFEPVQERRSSAAVRRKRKRDAKFEAGDKVKVATGTKDPDFGADISGWSGEIEDVEGDAAEGWLYCVVWDEATLGKMPRKLIRRSERANLDYLRIYLEEHELVFLS